MPSPIAMLLGAASFEPGSDKASARASARRWGARNRGIKRAIGSRSPLSAEKASSASLSTQLAVSVASAGVSCAVAANREDFPIPGSPCRTRTPLRLVVAVARKLRSCWSSVSLPTSGTSIRSSLATTLPRLSQPLRRIDRHAGNRARACGLPWGGA